VTWTGEELVVAGIGPELLDPRGVAAYNPATGGWRRLPDAPYQPTDVVWTGTDVLLVDIFNDAEGFAITRFAVRG
jgi:hypothetical protein